VLRVLASIDGAIELGSMSLREAIPRYFVGAGMTVADIWKRAKLSMRANSLPSPPSISDHYTTVQSSTPPLAPSPTTDASQSYPPRARP
jgi:hypothetical protein